MNSLSFSLMTSLVNGNTKLFENNYNQDAVWSKFRWDLFEDPNLRISLSPEQEEMRVLITACTPWKTQLFIDELTTKAQIVS